MGVPTPDVVLNDRVLPSARVAGLTELWRGGGAQAIGALAYGTESIRAVDKIVGPGNAYVAAAKRLVFGRVGIDSIAGPSEILVVADAENDPSRSEEHTSELQSLMRISYAVFCLNKKKHNQPQVQRTTTIRI